METTQPTAQELRAKARLQLHNAHQKLAEARHHLALKIQDTQPRHEQA